MTWAESDLRDSIQSDGNWANGDVYSSDTVFAKALLELCRSKFQARTANYHCPWVSLVFAKSHQDNTINCNPESRSTKRLHSTFRFVDHYNQIHCLKRYEYLLPTRIRTRICSRWKFRPLPDCLENNRALTDYTTSCWWMVLQLAFRCVRSHQKTELVSVLYNGDTG